MPFFLNDAYSECAKLNLKRLRHSYAYYVTKQGFDREESLILNFKNYLNLGENSQTISTEAEDQRLAKYMLEASLPVVHTICSYWAVNEKTQMSEDLLDYFLYKVPQALKRLFPNAKQKIAQAREYEYYSRSFGKELSQDERILMEKNIVEMHRTFELCLDRYEGIDERLGKRIEFGEEEWTNNIKQIQLLYL